MGYGMVPFLREPRQPWQAGGLVCAIGRWDLAGTLVTSTGKDSAKDGLVLQGCSLACECLAVCILCMALNGSDQKAVSCSCRVGIVWEQMFHSGLVH